MKRPHSSFAPWWFLAAFFAALGVLAAIKLSEWAENEWNAAAAIEAASQQAKEDVERTRTAKEFVLKHLRAKGIVALSDDAFALDDAGQTSLTAHGKDTQGKLHSVFAQWNVARFGSKTTWQCVAISLDDELIYHRDIPAWAR